MKKVYIIDYGMSNLLSIYRAIEKVSGVPILIDKPNNIAHWDYLVLPGVGAFPDGMSELKKRGFDEAIIEHSKTGKPFLGICLGMQLMLSCSEELEPTKGINLIEGEVKAIPKVGLHGKKIKVPHMSWNTITMNNEFSSYPHFQIEHKPYVYFVHSYCAQTEIKHTTYSYTSIDGFSFSSIINKDNLWGMQFHPEKSGAEGLQLLSSFLEL